MSEAEKKEAADKAAWVRRNRVPFPGDPGFEQAEARWASRGSWRCFVDLL